MKNDLDEILDDSESTPDFIEPSADQSCSAGLPTTSSSRVTGLIVAFLLMFRVAYGVFDRAIIVLLKFFKYLIRIVSKSFGSNTVEPGVPVTIKHCYAILNINDSPCKVYVTCPSCHLLNDIEKKPSEGMKYSFVEFPSHPQHRFREPCNASLFSKVVKRQKVVCFHPEKVYYYYGIKALAVLLCRPDLLYDCNSWVNNEAKEGIFADIIDGLVWKEIVASFSSLTSGRRNIIGIMINIDWFQPFKHNSIFDWGYLWGHS